MAEELFRGDRPPRGVVDRSQCRYPVLLASRLFSVRSKNVAQTFVARAESPAANEEHGQLDARRCPQHGAGSTEFVSPHCARWSAHAQRSGRTEPVQPSSTLLLNFSVVQTTKYHELNSAHS